MSSNTCLPSQFSEFYKVPDWRETVSQAMKEQLSFPKNGPRKDSGRTKIEKVFRTN